MKIVENNRFSCPSCGGYMAYSPKTENLLCPYCKTEMPILHDDTEIEEFDLFEENLSLHTWDEEKRYIKCSACSGQTILDATDITSECVFCGSKLVTEIKEEGLMPEGVIPFKIEKLTAKKNIKRWVKGKFYAPSVLKKSLKLEKIKSLYLPYFTYDSATETQFTCQVGHYYYVTRRRNNKTVRERRIRWHRESGQINEFYDDILVHASTKVDEKLINRMHSFDLESLMPYHKGYVVGHTAERYGTSLMDGWRVAKNYVKQDLTNKVRHRVGGDQVKGISLSTHYDQVKYKHILLPIWLTHYYYKEKLYHVYINGQNGRVVGSYPKSLGKILVTVLTLAMIVFAIYYIGVKGQIF